MPPALGPVIAPEQTEITIPNGQADLSDSQRGAERSELNGRGELETGNQLKETDRPPGLGLDLD